MVKKFKDRVAGRWLGFASGLLVITVSTTHAAQGNPSPDAAVTQLADAFVDEYERRFPFAVMEAGLELKSQSGSNINAPVDLARSGALPFAALNSKVARWVAAHR